MRALVYVVVLAAHAIGYLLFLRGFFPSKAVLSGYSLFYQRGDAAGASPFAPSEGTLPQQFDKIVLMVVDAMRADFLYSEETSYMSFVHQLVSQGHALPYTAYANAPTVTLPRLKGITTGGTPSFIDAVLNVADDQDTSQGLSHQDSWVRQFRYKGGRDEGKRIHFYGDDTWLKLFPPSEFFALVDGTNSFFVSDYTEVDLNVTRHLDAELAQVPLQWDALILHYLGLDHIGHKGGPHSPFMPDKHREMDAVIERIYHHIEQTDDTLLVVMGDHGMNEVGNHGGLSEGETHAGMLFVSPKFGKLSLKSVSAPVANAPDYSYFSEINQIDLVPTLAALLNFPIPKNNLGVIIKEHLKLWGSGQQRRILLENCLQFKAILDAKYGVDIDYVDSLASTADQDVHDLHHLWLDLTTAGREVPSIDQYYSFLYKTQSVLASSATNYNYTDIKQGYILILVSAFVAGVLAWYAVTLGSQTSRLVPFGYGVFTMAYASHFFGSSFIEEEHQIWWFLTIVCMLVLFAYARWQQPWYFALALAGIRAVRAFCNSGQKYKSNDTFSSYLLASPDLLWILNLATYLAVAISIFGQGNYIKCFSYPNYSSMRDRHVNDFGPLISFIVVFVSVSLSFLFKLIQFYLDGHEIPNWLQWLVDWNLESFGVQDARNADKKLLQSVVLQLSRLFMISLSATAVLRFVIGKVRGFHGAMYTDLCNIVIAFLVHQTRAELIPVFVAFFVIRFAVARILHHVEPKNLDSLVVALASLTLCLQNVSFFSMGNTNLLATVDLSNAYNGIKSYNVFLVGVLTFVSSYVGPIFWSLTSIGWVLDNNTLALSSSGKVNLMSSRQIRWHVFQIKNVVTLAFYTASAAVLVGSCINLRFHLFIWTVFSPKLLFFAAWTLLMNCLIDFVVVGLLLLVC